jgi:hypothetical protein
MTSDRQPAPTAPGICTPGAILAAGEIRARGRTAWACRVNQAHLMLERGGEMTLEVGSIRHAAAVNPAAPDAGGTQRNLGRRAPSGQVAG